MCDHAQAPPLPAPTPTAKLMVVRRALFASSAVLLALVAPTLAKLECRQPNYVTHDGKIWAQDPQTPGTETEVTIRGVVWGGMEKENMIPDGLWDTVRKNSAGTQGTKVSKLLEFLGNNSINSVRLPLSAQYLIANPLPQLAYINGWDNKELTTWANPNAVTYFDLVGRVVQTLQNTRVSVLLDIHLLDKYVQDAYWYTAPFVEITASPTYRAAEFLAKAFCNATYWNILGVDLKDEMSDVQWNANAGDADPKTDWHNAATTIANRVLELCPSWLVFVGGASSPTTAQTFAAGAAYKTPSRHWDGGNLHNATTRPLNVTLSNKLVLAPHAHAHGKLPQNYFYAPDANCSSASPSDAFAFEGDQLEMECVDFVNGAKVKSPIQCSTTEFGCSKYKHLTVAQIATTYQKVMDEAVGDVVMAGTTPVILGAFSGVYGAAFQPHQTAALDFLIDYAATKLRGGYFYALNPDTEYYLEDATNAAGSGLFGKTHHGLFKTTSWQEANTDLLDALKKLPTSAMPCYGGKSVESDGKKSAASVSSRSASRLVALGAFLVAAVFAM